MVDECETITILNNLTRTNELTIHVQVPSASNIYRTYRLRSVRLIDHF